MQETGYEYTAKEVIPEEAVTRDVTEEADASTYQHTHHLSETSWEKLVVLEQL